LSFKLAFVVEAASGAEVDAEIEVNLFVHSEMMEETLKVK
jgi:hypothetical protein